MGDVIQFPKRDPGHRQRPRSKGYSIHVETKLYRSEWVAWPEDRKQENDHEPQPQDP